MRLSFLHNSWRTWLLIVSVGINVSFVAGFVFVKYKHHREGHEEDSVLIGLRGQLQLTDNQQKQIERLKNEMFNQVQNFQRDLTRQREILSELLAAPNTDQAAIMARLDRISTIQRTVQRIVVDHLLEEKKLLSPEQQEVFSQIIRQRVCPRGGHGPESLPHGSTEQEHSTPIRPEEK